jgi:hypothetical protein
MRHAEGAELARPAQEFARCARRIAHALRRRKARALVAADRVRSTAATRAPAVRGRSTRRCARGPHRGDGSRGSARDSRACSPKPPRSRAPGSPTGQARLLARLAGPLEIARERQLDALLHADLDDATFARRLGAALADDRPTNDERRPGAPGRLHALLLLSPGSPGPPTTAP